MPFKSKAQWRAFYAMEKRGELPSGTAEKWAHETKKSFKKLPLHKGKKVSEAAMTNSTSGRSLVDEWVKEHGVDKLIEFKKLSTSGRSILEAFKLGDKIPSPTAGAQPFPKKKKIAPPEEEPPQEETPPEDEEEIPPEESSTEEEIPPEGEEEIPSEGEEEIPTEEGTEPGINNFQISVDDDGNILDGPEFLIGLNIVDMVEMISGGGAAGAAGSVMSPELGEIENQPIAGPAQSAVPPMMMPRVQEPVPTSPNRMWPEVEQPQTGEQPKPSLPGLPTVPKGPGFTPTSQVALGANAGLQPVQPSPSPQAISAAIAKHSGGLGTNLITILNMAAQNPKVPLRQLIQGVQLSPDELHAIKIAWYNIRQELMKPTNPIPLSPPVLPPQNQQPNMA